MKRIFLLLAVLPLLFVGCASEEEPEVPTGIHIDGSLAPYFCNVDGSGDRFGKANCDTIYNGTQYLIVLSAYAKTGTENNGLITSAIYYLNGNIISTVANFPFTASYIPNLQSGKYTLSVKPTFESEFITWKTQASDVYVKDREN
jgi:hypothetical protein